MKRLDFNKTDGGRAEAGFTGTAGDCVTRAIAIAADLPYQHVYDELFRRQKEFFKTTRSKKINKSNASPREGVYKEVYRPYLEELGFEWTATMQIGSGCQVHLRKDELPAGRLICCVSRHVTAVVDHTIHDMSNPDRGGDRCVYGYWKKPQKGFHQRMFERTGLMMHKEKDDLYKITTGSRVFVSELVRDDFNSWRMKGSSMSGQQYGFQTLRGIADILEQLNKRENGKI